MAPEPDALAGRFAAQLLTGPPAPTPEAVAERLLAVQGQDPRGARLAIRTRTAGLSAADVDRALSEERSLLISWLCRGTLHLVRSEDYPWLHALTTPPLDTGNARRLDQEGVSPAQAERGVQTIARSLADAGPLTRPELRDRIALAGVPTAGQAVVHLLAKATFRGLIVRGPVRGSEHAYVLVRDWLGPQRPVDRDRALAELARRYLAGHGPAGARDLAKWAGLPLRDARAGLNAIALELTERADGLVDLRRRSALAEGPPRPRLLGPYDPLLLGWCSRAAIVGELEGIVTTNGLFRPFALVRGRAVALWSLRDGRVTIASAPPLRAPDAAALEAEARDVERFLGRDPTAR